jgi:hypothetical protein
VATDPLVRHDPTEYRQLGIKSQKAIHPHIVCRIRNRRPMIDGSRVGIGSYHRAPLDALETPVIALSSGKEHPQGITQRIEGNNVGSRDGWHCWI